MGRMKTIDQYSPLFAGILYNLATPSLRPFEYKLRISTASSTVYYDVQGGFNLWGSESVNEF